MADVYLNTHEKLKNFHNTSQGIKHRPTQANIIKQVKSIKRLHTCIHTYAYALTSSIY